MTVYDSHQYRDPMLVLEQKQNAAERKAKQCGGCANTVTMTFKSEKVIRCTQKWQVYGRRCEYFEQKQISKQQGKP
jgi:hypothetical protein